MRCLFSLLVMLLGVVPRLAAAQAASAAPTAYLLRPARVFDGVSAKAQEGWVVLVQGERIAAAGPAAQRLEDVLTRELPRLEAARTEIDGLPDRTARYLAHEVS